jgi:hypothetical protein
MRRSRVGLLMAAAVSGLLAPLLFIGVGSSSAAATTNRFSIATNPGLIPAYNPKIQDYAIRCTGDPTTSVSTTGSGTVVVGGETFSRPVNLNVPLVAINPSRCTTEGALTTSVASQTTFPFTPRR